MKEVKICYSTTQNLGDLINPLIVEKILGYKPIWTDQFSCETSGIGSGLYRYFVKKEKLIKDMVYTKTIIKGKLHRKPLQIWSAGFISHFDGVEVPVRPNINVASVRGVLSKKRLEKIFKQKLDISTGDGGLLAGDLLSHRPTKKYAVGIIPHMREKDEPIFDLLKEKYEKYCIVIDVTDNALETIKRMAECQSIVSSSLHGLIIADSLRIPNRQFILTDKLVGDGFKFKDYYSSFGLEVTPFNLDINSNLDPDFIKENYLITDSMIENKKEDIIESFSRFIN